MSEVTMFHNYGALSEEFRKRNEEAGIVIVSGSRPNRQDWGICMGGGASAEIGGQLMMFSWFPDRDALVSALRSHLVFCFNPHDGFDLAAGQRRVEQALDAFVQHGDSNRLTDDLQAGLRIHIRIDWVGSFSELAQGDTEFARDLRADFLDDEDGQDRSLTEAEFEDFAAFLEGWMVGS